MTSSQYISVRETAQILRISEKKVMDLIDQEKLHAYRIADQFLRLKKSEVMNLKNSGQVTADIVQYTYTWGERFKDFFYFNDFYLTSVVAILGLLYVIFYF